MSNFQTYCLPKNQNGFVNNNNKCLGHSSSIEIVKCNKWFTCSFSESLRLLENRGGEIRRKMEVVNIIGNERNYAFLMNLENICQTIVLLDHQRFVLVETRIPQVCPSLQADRYLSVSKC